MSIGRRGVETESPEAVSVARSVSRPSTAAKPAVYLEAFQQLIDGLAEQVGLMDESWTIVALNRSWSRAAQQFNFAELVPGSNYFAFCEAKAAEGHGPAGMVADGIRRMNAGMKESFSFVYQGQERGEGRSFQLSIEKFPVGGRTFATVTRHDVTELVELRGLRENVSQSVELGQAQERQRIAREIHDSVVQSLIGLGFALAQMKRSGMAAAGSGLVAEMEQLLADAQAELRSISFLAHPPLLEDLGLRGAIEALVEGYSRRTGLKASLRFDAPNELRPAVAVVLYRIIQEGLTNVHRHSHADHATVTVVARKRMLHALVADDGIGMPKPVEKGVGLASMKTRLSELRGRLSFRTSPKGTTLIATVPAEACSPENGDLSV